MATWGDQTCQRFEVNSKELCLVGFYSKNTSSINFIAKIKEKEYLCIKSQSLTTC